MKKAIVSKHSSVNDGVGYSEIGQSQNTKQALLFRKGSKEFERMTGFVKCRDFLVDSYSYQKAGKDFSIYNFGFKGSKHELDWTGAYIQLRFAGEGSRANFLTHVEQVIHPIEAANKMKPTEIMEVEGSEDLVAIGDKRWLQNCLTFSLWSLLLRVCCYKFDATKDWIKTFSNMSSSDSKYIGSVPRETLDKVFNDLSVIETKTFCGFDPNKDGVGTIHHNSGFISVFGWHTEIDPSTVKQNQHWQEMQKRGLASKVA